MEKPVTLISELRLIKVYTFSFETYKQSFLLFFSPYFLLTILAVVIGVFNAYFYPSLQQSILEYIQHPETMMFPVDLKIIPSVALSIVSALLYWYAHCYSVVLTKRKVEGSEIDLKLVLTETYGKYWRSIKATLVLITIFAAALFLPSAFMTYFNPSESAWSSFLGWLFIIAFILVFITIFSFVYFAPRIAFFVQAIYVEDKGIIDSIKRSIELSKGRYWKNVTFFIILGIILEIPYYIINVASGSIVIDAIVITSILNFISSITNPLSPISDTVYFYSLRARLSLSMPPSPPPSLDTPNSQTPM